MELLILIKILFGNFCITNNNQNQLFWYLTIVIIEFKGIKYQEFW